MKHIIPLLLCVLLGVSIVGGGPIQPPAAELQSNPSLEVWTPEAPRGDCISDLQRADIERKIAAFEARTKRAAIEADPKPQSYPIFPQAGNLWQDLFVNNFVDLDPTSGIRDWDSPNLCTKHVFSSSR